MFELVQVVVWLGYGLYLFIAGGVPIVSLQGGLFFLLGPIVVGYVLAVPIEVTLLRILDLFPRQSASFFPLHVLSAACIGLALTHLGFWLINLI